MNILISDLGPKFLLLQIHLPLQRRLLLLPRTGGALRNKGHRSSNTPSRGIYPTLGKAMQLITSTGPPNVAWKIALRFWQSMALDAAFPVADLMALATPLMNRCVLFALRRGQQWAISLELVAKMAAMAIPIEFQHVAEVLACCLEAGAPLSTVQLCLRRHMSRHGGAGEDDGPLMLRIACAATANVDSNKTSNKSDDNRS